MKQTRTERGSMFLVALLTLFILTLVGLSLAVVTETEMILGSNEWAINEIHYAAEAGIGIQVAQMVVGGDPAVKTFVLPSYFGQKQPNQIGFDIRTTGLAEVDRDVMPYTAANMNDNAIHYAYYFMLSRAQRTAWSKGRDAPNCDDLERNQLGFKTISTGFYLAPVEPPASEALLAEERGSRDLKNTYDSGFSQTWGDGSDDICPYEAERNSGLTITNGGTFDNSANVRNTVKNDNGTPPDVLIRGTSLYYGYQ